MEKLIGRGKWIQIIGRVKIFVEEAPGLKSGQVPIYGVLCLVKALHKNISYPCNYYPMRFLPLECIHLFTIFQYIKAIYNFLSVSLCEGETFITFDLRPVMFSYLWPAHFFCYSISMRCALEAD